MGVAIWGGFLRVRFLPNCPKIILIQDTVHKYDSQSFRCSARLLARKQICLSSPDALLLEKHSKPVMLMSSITFADLGEIMRLCQDLDPPFSHVAVNFASSQIKSDSPTDLHCILLP